VNLPSFCTLALVSGVSCCRAVVRGLAVTVAGLFWFFGDADFLRIGL
jgi:hypothetical protein